MQPGADRERGSAMVMALGALVILAVIALSIVTIVTSEKRTGFSEYTGSRSFYSADAASEAGVNWVKHQYTPPPVVDGAQHVLASTQYTTTQNNNRYRFDVSYVRKRYRAGWSVEYKDYEYRVDALGASTQASEASIQLNATRLYREGY
jgi:Tfp pilus assembly protein PilX